MHVSTPPGFPFADTPRPLPTVGSDFPCSAYSFPLEVVRMIHPPSTPFVN